MRHNAKINLIFLILFTLLFSGCGIFKKSSAEKAMAEEQKIGQANAKEMQDAEKAHYKRQPAETRKMMKKSRKSSGKLNNPKRHSSFK